MHFSIVFGIAAIATLLTAVVFSWRQTFRREGPFWAIFAASCAVPLAVVLDRTHAVWQVDFATTIWVTVAATLALFMGCSIWFRETWRLAPLLSAYMLVLGLIGFAWQHVPPHPVEIAGGAMLVVHIGFAVGTYAMATLAAVAALAAFIQERALKKKRKPALDGVLPAVTECDGMVIRFLGLGEIVLGLGLISGAVLNLSAGNPLLTLDHKTLFTLAAFLVIGALLFLHATLGLRGRRAARLVLLAYLLLTLGYPGVKFVSDVLIG